MIVHNLEDPFPHVLFEDFYTEDEMALIWEELDFLNRPGKLWDNTIVKDNPAPDHKSGLYLDQVYPHRNMSNILTINRKIFGQADKVENYFLSNYLRTLNTDFTWICYYYDNTYYGMHPDNCVLTAVSTFWREPKMFRGGDLIFETDNYVPDMRPGSLILYPAYERHEVTNVKVSPWDQDNKLSRWSMNQFMLMEQPQR